MSTYTQLPTTQVCDPVVILTVRAEEDATMEVGVLAYVTAALLMLAVHIGNARKTLSTMGAELSCEFATFEFDDKLAEYCRKGTFKTVVGDITFNEEGEWSFAQVMAVQFQGVQGNGVDQFKDPKTEVILWPEKYKTGNIVYPYKS